MGDHTSQTVCLIDMCLRRHHRGMLCPSACNVPVPDLALGECAGSACPWGTPCASRPSRPRTPRCCASTAAPSLTSALARRAPTPRRMPLLAELACPAPCMLATACQIPIVSSSPAMPQHQAAAALWVCANVLVRPSLKRSPALPAAHQPGLQRCAPLRRGHHLLVLPLGRWGRCGPSTCIQARASPGGR